jgi:transcriptional regulator with XRE-family HTH domain
MSGQGVVMGKFYDLIQQHIDSQPYEVRERQVARRLGVTQTTLSNWREPKALIAKRHIVAVAELAGVRYGKALDALLEDIGYLTEDETQDTPNTETG